MLLQGMAIVLFAISLAHVSFSQICSAHAIRSCVLFSSQEIIALITAEYAPYLRQSPEKVRGKDICKRYLKKRKTGIGLTAIGGAMLPGGMALIALGVQTNQQDNAQGYNYQDGTPSIVGGSVLCFFFLRFYRAGHSFHSNRGPGVKRHCQATAWKPMEIGSNLRGQSLNF